MENKEKCLVIEAMEKCQCKLCKSEKRLRDVSLELWASGEVLKIFMKSLKDTEKQEEKANNECQ